MAQHRSKYSPLRAAALAPHDFPWGTQDVHTWSLLKIWNFTQNIHERHVRIISRKANGLTCMLGNKIQSRCSSCGTTTDSFLQHMAIKWWMLKIYNGKNVQAEDWHYVMALAVPAALWSATVYGHEIDTIKNTPFKHFCCIWLGTILSYKKRSALIWMSIPNKMDGSFYYCKVTY